MYESFWGGSFWGGSYWAGAYWTKFKLFSHAEFWDGVVVMNMACTAGVVMNRAVTGTYSELEEL